MNAGPWEGPLRLYPAPFRPTGPPIPLGNAGGYSGARLWRIAAPVGPIVLRLWPPDGPGRDGLEVIHGWLARARDLGFVPAPIPATDGRTTLEVEGRLWELAPWLPGQPDPARPPSPARIRAMFAALAGFHARLKGTSSPAPSPGLESRRIEVERLLGGEFDALAVAHHRVPADPISPLADRWLALARPLAPGVLGRLRQAQGRPLPLQPCLRDARRDHFLFEADRLTGLVDFGAMGRDTVAGDLARLLADAIGHDQPARDEALAAYETFRPLHPAETQAIPIFEQANALLAPARWARWHFLERRRFDDPEATRQGFLRGLGRLVQEFGLPANIG